MVEIIVIVIFVIILIAVFAGLFGSMIKTKSSGPASQSVQENANAIIARAKSIYEMGQLSNAIKFLEDSVKKHSDSIPVRMLLGDYLLEKQLPIKAEKHYKHVMKLAPQNKIAYEKNADCYYLLGKFDKALELYANLLNAAPDNAELREKVADIYFRKEDYDQAIIEYRAVLNKKHFDTGVKRKLADVFFIKTDYNRAIREYEEIMKIDGASTAILKRVAKAYHNLQKHTDAALIYKRIIDQDESDATAYKDLAELYVSIKNFDKAAKTYSIMLEKGMEVPPKILARLSEIYLLTEEYDKAITICDKILSERPNSIPVIEVLAKSNVALKKYELAIQNFKRLLEEETDKEKLSEHNHSISSVLCAWGNEFFVREDYQTAMDKYVEAIQYDDENPEVYINLGRTNNIIKNYDAAINHFTKGLELSDYAPDVYITIAQIYKEIEQVNSAIDLYYDAIKKYPENAEMRQELGDCLIHVGYYPQAESELLVAVELNPDSTESHYNLALAYEYQQKNEEAKMTYKKVLDRDEHHEEAREKLNLLSVQETQGNSEEPTT